MPDRKRKYFKRKNSEKLCTLLCKPHCEYYWQLLLIIPPKIAFSINEPWTYQTDLKHINEQINKKNE